MREYYADDFSLALALQGPHETYSGKWGTHDENNVAGPYTDHYVNVERMKDQRGEEKYSELKMGRDKILMSRQIHILRHKCDHI